MNKDIEQAISAIASNHLQIETLETQNSDSLDFQDVAVWSIKAALVEAFELGQQNSNKG